jgi:hypothetical protein
LHVPLSDLKEEAVKVQRPLIPPELHEVLVLYEEQFALGTHF